MGSRGNTGENITIYWEYHENMIGYKNNNLPWGCSEGEHHRYNYEILSFTSWDTTAATMVNYTLLKMAIEIVDFPIKDGDIP